MITLFCLLFNLLVTPLLLVGVVRKVKALMQTRVGAPILQPFLRRGETVGQRRNDQ